MVVQIARGLCGLLKKAIRRMNPPEMVEEDKDLKKVALASGSGQKEYIVNTSEYEKIRAAIKRDSHIILSIDFLTTWHEGDPFMLFGVKVVQRTIAMEYEDTFCIDRAKKLFDLEK